MWAIVQTYARCEHKAIENLHRQNYDAFCPLLAHYSSKARIVESPLFPCYVFVDIAPQQPWYAINSTYGVIRLLTDRNKINPKPVFVHDKKINEILVLARAAEDPLPAGTLVRIRGRNNPLYDMVGTVVGMSKLMRVSVMMHIFSRDVIVEFVSPSELEKV